MRTGERPSALGAAPPVTPRIAVRGVHKAFHDVRKRRTVQALAGIDLAVSPGEFVTILGASGCGKSTLLHIMGGFEQPTTGAVLVDDKPVLRPTRDCGMVFQQATLFPWKTIRDNVSWPYRAAGTGRRVARERALDLLDLVGVREFADAYPAQLSGGMRQRASIARTLAMEPRVLLMDEPFGALDALTRELMQEELIRLVDERELTVVFVTHDITEAVFLGDRTVVLTRRPGRIAVVDDIDLPRPRGAELKGSPVIAEYHQRYWEILRDEQDAAAGDR